MSISLGGAVFTAEQKAPAAVRQVPAYLKIFYITLNVFAACSIVFANKIVFSVFNFRFVTTLTLIHTIFTWTGMVMLQRLGFFESKKFTHMEVAPLALGYVGYVVLNNLSLNLNAVGFYQILKITITPTVIVLEFLLFRKVQSSRVLMAVSIVCVGVAVAAVTDKVAISNIVGVLVGLASVVVTGLYQIWAGSKQKELRANSSQLLLAYTPQAVCLLAVMAPILDDMGVKHYAAGAKPGVATVLGFPYTAGAVSAIVVSGLLGVLVSLSTFLVIGATSSLTYNVVGHSKTVVILAGGCLIFDEAMPLKRLAGIVVTMAGIAWYTALTLQEGSSTVGGGPNSTNLTPLPSMAGAPPVTGAAHSHKGGLMQNGREDAYYGKGTGGSGLGRGHAGGLGSGPGGAEPGGKGVGADEREPLLAGSVEGKGSDRRV